MFLLYYRPCTYNVISPWLIILGNVETRESVVGPRTDGFAAAVMTVRARRIVSLLPDQDLAKKCAG